MDELDNILPLWSSSTSTSLMMIFSTNQRPKKCDMTERKTFWHYDDQCPPGSGRKNFFHKSCSVWNAIWECGIIKESLAANYGSVTFNICYLMIAIYYLLFVTCYKFLAIWIFLSETCYYLQKLVPFVCCCTSRNFFNWKWLVAYYLSALEEFSTIFFFNPSLILSIPIEIKIYPPPLKKDIVFLCSKSRVVELPAVYNSTQNMNHFIGYILNTL